MPNGTPALPAKDPSAGFWAHPVKRTDSGDRPSGYRWEVGKEPVSTSELERMRGEMVRGFWPQIVGAGSAVGVVVYVLLVLFGVAAALALIPACLFAIVVALAAYGRTRALVAKGFAGMRADLEAQGRLTQ